MRPSIAAVAVVAAALFVAACGGQSASEKAQSQVCDAKADIGKQIDTLKAVTPSAASVSAVQNALNAIRSDLSTIADAQGQLSSDRKQQVQDANSAFTKSLQDTISGLGSSLNLQTAATQLQAAVTTLASSYQQAFSQVSC